jgi:hypothetical protein
MVAFPNLPVTFNRFFGCSIRSDSAADRRYAVKGKPGKMTEEYRAGYVNASNSVSSVVKLRCYDRDDVSRSDPQKFRSNEKEARTENRRASFPRCLPR